MVRRIVLHSLGIEVTPLTSVEVAEGIYKAVSSETPLRIANHNLHGVYLYHTDPAYRVYCDSADWLLVDGWPIWLAMKMQSTRNPGTETRIGSSDWLQRLIDLQEPLNICAVGGTAASAARAAEAINASYPHIRWQGFDGFNQAEKITHDLVDALSMADIVLVGMGMPLQERWIMDNAQHLQSKVVANVGGCIDYFAGTQKHAPRWLGRIGLEWVYRFLADPRRLARRYFCEPFQLVPLLITRRLEKREGSLQ